MKKKEHLTVAEAAAQLGISENRIRRMINAGELPAIRYGKAWRIAVSDVQKKREEMEK